MHLKVRVYVFLVETYTDYDNGYLPFIIMILFFPSNSIPQLILFFTIHLVASYRYRSNHDTSDYECQHCHALFWYSERTSISRSTGIVQYNNCCKGGKLCLPPYRPRPHPLASLARFYGDSASRKFIRSIRQYNCLFAFTSMGACIDNSVNDGHGPPLFKICGQVHHRI
jgi:hypothetical protein